MNNDFSEVKIGDRLWSSTFGWIVVNAVSDSSIAVQTCEGTTYYYDFMGRIYSEKRYPQSLFFEEMQLIPKPEEAKTFDPNKPYRCRDGKDCKIVHTAKNGKFIVVALENDAVYCCHKNGRYLESKDHEADLVNIPEKIEGWINIYPEFIHNTKEDADEKANDFNRIACKFISFKEGDGL